MLRKRNNSEGEGFSGTDIGGGVNSFQGLGDFIIASLSVGVVAFDRDFKVMVSNSAAGRIIDVGVNISESLSRGTDKNVWDWDGIFGELVKGSGEKEFDNVRYEIGGAKKILNIFCTPVFSGSLGDISGGAVVIEDVTEKVEIARQLGQFEKHAAIGRVAGKVAHELNNPMDGILRYINLSIRYLEKECIDKPLEYLGHCRAGLMRMVHIISELLEFSRGARMPVEFARIDQVVSDAVKTQHPESKNIEVEIIRDCPAGMPKLRAAGLFQVFCNLIRNSIDACDGGGRIEVRIFSSEGRLSVEIEDDGPGFEPEMGEVIFEPFFTTKTGGKGIGLGLAICKDIVEKYGGRIWASNSESGGSVFTVELDVPFAGGDKGVGGDFDGGSVGGG
jgi:signal transduction histidine kinase